MENNKTDINDKEILQGIQNQIGSFDSKAGILISVVSIILALSLSLIDVLLTLKGNIIPYIIFSIIYFLFMCNAIITISLSVLVVIPRSTPKEMFGEDKHKSVNYYKDLTKMSYNNFIENKEKFYGNEQIMFTQIKVNSLICNKKHFFLSKAILSLISLASLIVIMLALSIIFLAII